MSKKEDDERFRNLLLYKMYATDEEVNDMMPWVVVVAIIVAAVIIWG